MLDCQLFDLNPGPQHLVNVMFHAANTVLLFVLLLRLTRALWPAALAAALFAWHPLHVESVAWIAERKDMLSTFFGLLTLLAYARFVEASKARSPKAKAYYAVALVMFALGLMSKPMLVTWPFVMLLLDFWPLQRFKASTLPRLVVEKIPFLLLAAISCVVTFLVQHGGGAVISLGLIPLRYRLVNTPVAYCSYLVKTLWPANLAVFYPLPEYFRRTDFFMALVLLLVVTGAVWRIRRSQPYWLFGWLWFLGTLVPVIGLVQVGGAGLADRYTYIPSIGLFMAVAFGFRDGAERFRFPKSAIAAAITLILGGCIFDTEYQLSFWRDSDILFRHALAVTRNNDIAHNNLGVALEQEGRPADALAEYRKAEKLAPTRYMIRNNLGNLLDKMGEREEALAEYREAVRLDPKFAFLRNTLGIELAELGRFDEALNEFTNAIQLDPDYSWPHVETAKVLLKQGRDSEAIAQFREALQIEPDNYQILAYTARVLAAEENPGARDGRFALTLATKANELSGQSQPLVLDILGMAFAATGDFSNAQICAQNAADLATASKMKDLDAIRQRLQLYQNHQPWRESFRGTNILVGNGLMK
jgi:tetratricopeptide (TPR) repeat protein